jgi:hypothetical protein
MKNGIIIVLFAVFAAAIGYLLFFKDSDDDYEEWKKKIDRHAFVADSLGKVVEKIYKQAYEKDSVLLAYMQTLNKSLYELDKEAAKNKALINQNEQMQAQMVKDLCDRLSTEYKPDFCTAHN